MRIMQVMAGAEHGGAETAFVDMCLAMREAGFDQHVVTRANDLRVPQLRAAGLTVDCLPFGGALDIYTPWQMKKIIAQFKPQIVQTWMARAAWKTPADPKSYRKVSRLGGYYNLKYFRTTDEFTTITPDIRDYLMKAGISPERVRHINNFAETEAVDKPVSKRELNTPDNAIAVLALGRLHVSKALDVLIKAVENLHNVHLWIAGEGDLRTELAKVAYDAGVETRVHFLGWRADRAALLQACDICVFPSRYEPFGTVFVQAWANHTPVICSRADGPRQFVRDGEDGLLFDIDDIAGLTASLKKLIADPGLQDKLAANGYERYLGEFTKEKTVQAYRNFYAEILARAGITI